MCSEYEIVTLVLMAALSCAKRAGERAAERLWWFNLMEPRDHETW